MKITSNNTLGIKSFSLSTIINFTQDQINDLDTSLKNSLITTIINKKEVTIKGIYIINDTKVLIVEFSSNFKPYVYTIHHDLSGVKTKTFDIFSLDIEKMRDFMTLFLRNHGMQVNYLEERKELQEFRQKTIELKESIEKLSKANKEVVYKYKKIKSKIKTINIKEIRKEIANNIKNKNVDPEKLKLELEKLKAEFDERNEFYDFLKTKNKDTAEIEKELILKLNKIAELETKIQESESENNFIQYHQKNEKLQEKVMEWKKFKVENGSWKR